MPSSSSLPLSEEDLLRFLDREFRYQAREVFLLHSLSLSERVERYMAIPKATFWKVEGTGKERLYLFRLLHNPSKFREGDRVLISPYKAHLQGHAIRQKAQQAIFLHHSSEKGLLWLRGDRGPLHLRSGEDYTLNVSLPTFFPTYSYASWGIGLLASSTSHGNYLKQLLTGQPLSQLPLSPPPPSAELTQAQKKAYLESFRTPLTLIQGPPGTGKTHLLACIALGFAQLGKRVLLSAFTHRAINHALTTISRLSQGKSPLWKIGEAYSANGLASSVQLVEGRQKKAFWSTLPQLSGSIVGATVYSAFYPFASAMLRTYRRLKHLRPQRERWLPPRFWSQLCQYVGTLCREASWDPPETYFDVVIFDEASQLLLPHALLPMAHSRHFIFIGDHAQLPPLVADETEEELRPYTQSLLERLSHLYPERKVLLDTSFRLGPSLVSFPSQAFYEGQLQSGRSHPRPDLDRPLPEPYQNLWESAEESWLILLQHTGATNESPLEALWIADMACALLASGLREEQLAIISPYRRQNNCIRHYLAQRAKEWQLSLREEKLTVDTVERIQGGEREVIFYSLTVSDTHHMSEEESFLFSPQRFNVAITRAKAKLFVVASPTLFRYVPAHLRLGVSLNTSLLPIGQPSLALDTDDRRRLQSICTLKRWYWHQREKGAVWDGTEWAKKLFFQG